MKSIPSRLLAIAVVVPMGSTFSRLWTPGIFFSTTLYAKTKSKQGIKSVSATNSGFAGATKSTIVRDTVAFPALEPDIAATLLEFNGDNSKAKDLSADIYGRIAGIYGFRSFNYLMEDTPETSLNDLLSSPTSATKMNESVQIVPITNFADLLSHDQGERTSMFQEHEESLPLSNLPPFDTFRVLHLDPLILSIDHFFTSDECDNYIQKSTASSLKSPLSPIESRSQTVGKDALAAAQRTSTTWFHHYKTVPELLAKASRLMGLDDILRWEEPQTVRYKRNERFTWHLDALAPSDELNKRGGQRVATLLVYLTDLTEKEGGATIFRDLGGRGNGPLRMYVLLEYSIVIVKSARAIITQPASHVLPVNPRRDPPSCSSQQPAGCKTCHLIFEPCIVEKRYQAMRNMTNGLPKFG